VARPRPPTNQSTPQVSGLPRAPRILRSHFPITHPSSSSPPVRRLRPRRWGHSSTALGALLHVDRGAGEGFGAGATRRTGSRASFASLDSPPVEPAPSFRASPPFSSEVVRARAHRAPRHPRGHPRTLINALLRDPLLGGFPSRAGHDVLPACAPLRRDRARADPAQRGNALVWRTVRSGRGGCARGAAPDPGPPLRGGLRWGTQSPSGARKRVVTSTPLWVTEKSPVKREPPRRWPAGPPGSRGSLAPRADRPLRDRPHTPPPGALRSSGPSSVLGIRTSEAPPAGG
jgi:hypothetical protein